MPKRSGKCLDQFPQSQQCRRYSWLTNILVDTFCVFFFFILDFQLVYDGYDENEACFHIFIYWETYFLSILSIFLFIAFFLLISSSSIYLLDMMSFLVSFISCSLSLSSSVLYLMLSVSVFLCVRACVCVCQWGGSVNFNVKIFTSQ